MILCYDENGWISVAYSNPIPEGLQDHLAGLGIMSIEIETDLSSSDVIEQFYVAEGEIVQRPEFLAPPAITTQVGAAPIKLLALPTGTTIKVDGEIAGTVDTSGELEITADMPAEFDIGLSLWPYLPRSIKVIINEA